MEAPSYPRGAIRKYIDVQDGHLGQQCIILAKVDTDTLCSEFQGPCGHSTSVAF